MFTSSANYNSALCSTIRYQFKPSEFGCDFSFLLFVFTGIPENESMVLSPETTEFLGFCLVCTGEQATIIPLSILNE